MYQRVRGYHKYSVGGTQRLIYGSNICPIKLGPEGAKINPIDKGPPFKYDKVHVKYKEGEGSDTNVPLTEDSSLCSNKDMDRKERKWDEGKLKYDLILPEFFELMAEILTKGELNHPKDLDGTPSWMAVEPEAYLNATLRHVQASRKGELNDVDMGTNHWGHVAVNAMFMWWFSERDRSNTTCVIEAYKKMVNKLTDEGILDEES